MNLLNMLAKAIEVLEEGAKTVDNFERNLCDKYIPNNNGRMLDNYTDAYIDKVIDKVKEKWHTR